MRIDLVLALFITVTIGYGQSVPIKRQGLFSCSGWGASCMSGWRRQHQKTVKPKVEPVAPIRHRVVSRPRNHVTKFWLTTEKAWGPMGKRSETIGSRNDLLNSLSAILQDQRGKMLY